MKIIKTILPILLLVVALAACNGVASTPQLMPTSIMETAISSAKTQVAATLAAIPTITPTATFTVTPTLAPPDLPTEIPGTYAIIPAKPDERVYTDPEGWYSVNFPADLKPTEKPNYFSRPGNFLETGYLPELGYMSKAINVCTWLANIESKPEQSLINWLPPCSLSTQSNQGQTITYQIFENPTADSRHHFIYIKTDLGPPWSNLDYLKNTFSWLKPVPETKPETDHMPLSSEGAAFWENTTPMPSNISVTEYALPPDKNPNKNDGLFQFVPTQAWPVRKANTSPTPHKTTLEELGYEFRTTSSQLYRDGRLLFDHVGHVSPVYTFSTDSGPIHAFVVISYINCSSFLIQNDAIHKWGDCSGMDSGFAPILYQGELLWATVTQDAQVEIKRSNGDIIFTFATYFAASLPKIQFRDWNGHWILEVGDFVIQDGEVLNPQLGFDEIFNWSLVKDKPTYFFRKESRVGISYGGQILPLQYQEVAHGLCCGPAQNNPGIGNDFMHFYGKRDGVWYYVVVKFK